MTREEAKAEHDRHNSLQFVESCAVMESDEVLKLIDEIYDDFESRTCENCKHGEYEKNIKGIYCSFVNYCGSDYMEKDFGCNKFERVEDDT